MKNNTESVKNYLQQAIKNTPNDFALQEVRYHMNQALLKLNKVEEKRDKREQNFQQQNCRLKTL